MSSTIRFSCEHCRVSHEAPTRHAGKLGKCSACRKRMRVPEPVEAQPAAFQHTTGSEERQTSCLLVIEGDALRVLGWKGPALPAGEGPH